MPSATDPKRKSFRQLCTIATALDVAGDRWTFLILRELLGGPARFQQLLDGLPGIARNLLTDRLRRLEQDGIVRRVDSQGTPLYALTDLGAGARPALEALGFWGFQLNPVAPAQHSRSIRAIAMALQAILARAGDALPLQSQRIELEVEGEHVEIVLGPAPTAVARLAIDPDARISVPRQTLSDFLLGQPFDEAQFSLVSGDPLARKAFLHAAGVHSA